MKVCARRFNIILALAAAAVLLCGCQTSKHKDISAALRVYLETNPDRISTNRIASVVREHPMTFSVAAEPVLTEASLIAARVINSQGGYALDVQFDEIGTDVLEQYSASELGKHFVIYGQWGKTAEDGRWLAAPLITRRISDGKLVFTPDASSDEINHLVLGLNNVIKQIHKKQLK